MTRIVKIEKNGGPEVLKLEDYYISVNHLHDEVTIEHVAIGLNFTWIPIIVQVYIQLSCPLESVAEGCRYNKRNWIKSFKILLVGDNIAYAGMHHLGAYSTERILSNKKFSKSSR